MPSLAESWACERLDHTSDLGGSNQLIGSACI